MIIENFKHDLQEQGLSNDDIEEVLEEKKLKTIFLNYPNVSDSIITQTLFAIADIKCRLMLDFSVIGLFALPYTNDGSKEYYKLVNLPETHNLHCILCMNEPKYVGAWIQQDDNTDIAKRAFLYFTCDNHFPKNITDEAYMSKVIDMIEKICYRCEYEGVLALPPFDDV